MILLDESQSNRVTISGFSLSGISSVHALQNSQDITYQLEEGNLTLDLPEMEDSPAYVFRIDAGAAS